MLTDGEADAALAASVFHYGTLRICGPEGIPGPARHPGADSLMIFPCIDLMDGKVVQLVQGREKALEADAPLEMLRRFAAFPEIQVIDLNAAMGTGSNDELVRLVAAHGRTRVGGGVRSVDRARTLRRSRRAQSDRGHGGLRCGGINRAVPGGAGGGHR